MGRHTASLRNFPVVTRLCVVGDSARAGVIAARLATGGIADVSQITKGAHLDPIRANGLRVTGGRSELVAQITATDDAATLGPQDYVLLATGAAALPAALGEIASLLGPETCVLTVQAGVPWWYFHCHPGPFDKLTIDAIDPLGKIWETIGPGRALAVVPDLVAEFVAPGVIAHSHGESVTLGEPSGEVTTRLQDLAQIMQAADLRATVSRRIRLPIWAALRTRIVRVLQEQPASAEDAAEVARELADIAVGLGIDRTALETGSPDVESGAMRPGDLATEIAALLELGRLVTHGTPHLDRVQDRQDLDTLPGPG